MKFQSILFTDFVQDPRDMTSLHKKAYSAPVAIEAQGDLVTLTDLASGRKVVTNVRYSGVPVVEAPAAPVSVTETITNKSSAELKQMIADAQPRKGKR